MLPTIYRSFSMRTSRVSQETAKIVDALSTPARCLPCSTSTPNLRRTYTSSRRRKGEAVLKPVPTNHDTHTYENDSSSALSSANTTDIEDLLTTARPRKRKRSPEAPSPEIPASFGSKDLTTAPARSSTKSKLQPKVEDEKPKGATNASRNRRLPSRKITASDGTTTTQPPSNWETIYDTVKDMRLRNPTAPVDTMGCAELYWRSSSPRERRFHILIALMLSSQTKDTVTAVAMQRLHTELGPGDCDSSLRNSIKSENEEKVLEIKREDTGVWNHKNQVQPSTLTLENILSVAPTRLNELIRTVGFHNSKTKYIKSAAIILRDEYGSDIPSTPEGLMRLPGVGPKMAYLCMSAAWGRTEGIGVDVHVHRITNLWGWHKTKTPEETRLALEAWLPREKWHEINKLLVGLGQTVCLPIGRRCGECDLAGTGLCKGEVKGLKGKK